MPDDEDEGEAMKLVIYCRTSTNEQRNNGSGIKTQESEARAWAKREGHKIVAIYRDEALSGTLGPEDRPALTQALMELQEGAQGIVAQHADRLSRTLHGQEAIFRKVWDHGAKVFTTSGEILEDDPDDPTRTFVRQILGAAAELERGMIRARMRAGIKRKKDQGGYAGGGIPYGQRSVHGVLVKHPKEQKALGVMWDMRAEAPWCSLREIGLTLDEMNLPPRMGGSWHPYAVARALRYSGWTRQAAVEKHPMSEAGAIR